MRRQRSIRYPLAFLTVLLGVGAAPTAARAAAGDDPGPDATMPADPPAEPQAPPDPQPEPQPTPEPAPASEPEPAPTTPPPPSTERAPEPEPAPERSPRPQPAPEPALSAEVDVPAEPAPPSVSAPDEDEEPHVANGMDGITRPIAFPVLGAVQYSNDWGACRDGCARHHEGTDLLGVRMQPLLAAVDGTVTRIRHQNVGTAGVKITITGADGWYYNYFHVNDDTPGTDDGLAGPYWQVSPGLAVGSPVRAGQVIGYMGDSGNAEGSVPHLHFEIRTPDRTPVNPYHSLVAAQRLDGCATDDATWTNADLAALTPSAVEVVALDGAGRWVIDIDGSLHAEGSAARIRQESADCHTVQPLTAAPGAEPAVNVPAEPAVDPAAAPAADRWTVAPGESLWRIVQTAYGQSDTAATIALVDLVFDHNGDQLTDPDVLKIGTTLELPPIVV